MNGGGRDVTRPRFDFDKITPADKPSRKKTFAVFRISKVVLDEEKSCFQFVILLVDILKVT